MRLRPLLAASAVLLVAPPARAERPRDAVTLTYLPSRATVALCPSADYLETEVFVRLGYELFQKAAPDHLTVAVDRVNGLFRAVAELRDDDGTITFSDTFHAIDCTLAVHPIAVVVAIRFTRLLEPPAPCPSALLPPGPSLPGPPPPAPAWPAPAPVLTPPERPRFQAGLASVFAIGKAPVVLGGAGWFLGVRWRDFSAALEGRALFAPSAEVEGISLNYSLLAASGVTCLHYEWAIACLRGEVGSLFGSAATGRTEPKHAPSTGVAIRLAGDWTVAPTLAVRPYFEIMGETASSRMISNERVNPLWISPSLSASIGLGLVMSRAGLSQETK